MTCTYAVFISRGNRLGGEVIPMVTIYFSCQIGINYFYLVIINKIMYYYGFKGEKIKFD
jgi:hypothetical protein